MDIDDEPAAYLAKSSSAGRMGKAAEYLIASVCILATRGELNVSTSLVDDEGVDLVFNRRNSSATLAVQVKARMSDSKLVQGDTVMAFVRKETFRPRSDMDLLFAAIDITVGGIMCAWLIPSGEFATLAGGPNSRGRLRFSASMRDSTNDKWACYRLTAAELPVKILSRLHQP
jgi:hypothetical protein